MHRLIKGFAHFRQNVYPRQYELFKDLAHQQRPHTMIITCSDSRILPERIFTTEPGDIFVYRNVGNIVPPYAQQVSGEVAAIEYAITVLNVEHVVVCGHSDCGAMKAALHREPLHKTPSVGTWLKHADRACHVCSTQDHADDRTALKRLTEENVLAQLDHLRTLPVVAAGLSRGSLEIHGWVYDIPEAILHVYDPDRDTFHPLTLSDAHGADELSSPAMTAGNFSRTGA